MKDKYRTFFKLAAVCAIGFAVCYGIFRFIDNGMNGFVLDWFTKRFTREYTYEDNGYTYIISEPLWPEVKDMLFRLLCIAVIGMIVIVYTALHFYTKRKVRENTENISREIQAFMQQEDGHGAAKFAEEHEQIGLQMAEIAAQMKHHEQMLKAESDRKNDLLVYLAHDLKTPLTSVLGYLSLLSEAPDMPTEQRAKYVNIALDKAQRLEKLMNEFFEITRYNLGQMELEEERIDLCYMLVQMTDEFYPLLSAHGNTINLQVAEDAVIYGDSIKLARVFNNILKNAIAYSYRDSVIDVWVEENEKEVNIFFRNKGKTIPEHKLKLIFDKFFRMDEARTTNSGGAGLGLAIAKEIITLHGGTIMAKSEKEITTFTVCLPMEAA